MGAIAHFFTLAKVNLLSQKNMDLVKLTLSTL